MNGDVSSKALVTENIDLADRTDAESNPGRSRARRPSKIPVFIKVKLNAKTNAARKNTGCVANPFLIRKYEARSAATRPAMPIGSSPWRDSVFGGPWTKPPPRRSKPVKTESFTAKPRTHPSDVNTISGITLNSEYKVHGKKIKSAIPVRCALTKKDGTVGKAVRVVDHSVSQKPKVTDTDDAERSYCMDNSSDTTSVVDDAKRNEEFNIEQMQKVLTFNDVYDRFHLSGTEIGSDPNPYGFEKCTPTKVDGDRDLGPTRLAAESEALASDDETCSDEMYTALDGGNTEL